MQRARLYLQLYSLRHEAAADPAGTVRRVPALGFDGVELVGDYGWETDAWRSVLDEMGLTVVAAHFGLEALESDLAGRVAFHRVLGTTQFVVTALPRAVQSEERYRGGARRLNAVAGRLADAGVALAFHNHSYEFEPLAGGGCGMDILLAETDPARVRFEFDTRWLESSGRNAVDFIREHAGRVGLIHAKDVRKRDGQEVPAGQGDVDFRSLMPLCAAYGWPVVLEYEGPSALEGVRQGGAFLRGLLG